MIQGGRIKKALIFTLRFFAWAIGGVLTLILLVLLLIQMPPIQRMIGSQAASFLSNTIGAPVRIGQVSLLFPKTLEIKGLYVEGQHNDTLLFSQKLVVDVDLLALLNNSIQVKTVEMENATAHIYRSLPDSSFNFDFIIDAFVNGGTVEVEEETGKKENGQGDWEFKIFGLELNNVYLTFNDETTASEANLNLGRFLLEIEDLGLDQNYFEIDLVELDGLRLDYSINAQTISSKEEKEESGSPPPVVKLNRLRLNDVLVNYANVPDGQDLELVLGAFGIDAANLDLATQKIDVGAVSLENTALSFTLAMQPGAQSPDTAIANFATDEENDGPGWALALEKINFDGVNLTYNNLNEPRQPKGVDFNHLAVKDFVLMASGILYAQDYIQVNLEQLAFKEQSGFRLDGFSTNITVEEHKATFADFNLKTGSSRIANHFEITYPSIEKIGEDLSRHAVVVDLDGTSIGISDLLNFVPALSDNPALSANSHREIKLGGRIEGPVSDLLISHFNLGLGATTSLSVNGAVQGLPEAKNAIYNIEKFSLVTTRQDIITLVPDTLLPQGVSIPQNIAMEAFFNGGMDDFTGKMDLKTSLGNVFANVRMQPGLKNIPTYKADLELVGLDLGKLLRQPETFGRFEMKASVDGSGTTPETIKADVSAVVTKAGFNNYEYTDLSIDGLYLHQQFNGTVKMEDENLDFEFAGLFDLSEEFPDVNAIFALKGINLKALNFTEDDIRVQAVLNADIKGSNIDNLNGNIGIRDVIVIKNKQSYRVDSLLFASITDDVQTNISIESDFLSAHLSGAIHPSDIGKVLQGHFNKFFSTVTEAPAPTQDKASPQVFEFDLTVRDPVILTDLLVPGLKELKPVSIRGKFNSELQRFNVNLHMPLIVYETTRVDSMLFDVFTKDGSMQFNLQISEVSTPSVKIPNIGYTGNIANNLVLSNFSITDNDGSRRVSIPLNVHGLKDTLLLTLYPGDIVLDYMDWKVPNDNAMIFLDNGFVVRNLVLERQGQFISVNSMGENPESPLELSFKNFNIGNLSGIIEGENDTLYRGVIDGEILLRDLQKNMVFTSDLNISGFSYKNDTVGNIALKANNIQQDVYNISAAITGFGNQVNLDGTYTQATKSIKMEADIQNFELSRVESFVENAFHSLSGNLKGHLDISGTIDVPIIRGDINFINTGFNLIALNSYFTMRNERIVFDRKGIRFPALTIRDTLGNRTTVNGYVLTQNYRDMEFDLDVKSNNFLALNRPKEQLDLYYGTIILDSDIKVRGNPDKPVVDARIGLLKGTSLTLVVPETQVSMVEKEGIVEFVTIEEREMSDIMNVDDIPEDTLRAEMRGIDLRANVTIDEETTFKIIIDESTGDFLEVKGGANISFGIDPGGAMSLTGSYEIKRGQYQLSFYNLVKREFAIRPGSSITWKGDPLNADVDISAIHTVRTSPAELMASQATDEETRRAMGGQLPFEVYLNMRGELLKPEIDFNIELPDDRKGALNGTVNSRLNILNEQESELNKQVFALLVLGRFIPEDPLDASGGGGVTSTARSSASKMLTQQLNQLSGKYVRGVDLTFDLESYEEFGVVEEGRTELQVGLSKAFLDERLRVEVGGRVDLEGERRREQRNVSDIAGDVAVEYMLTEDGTYRLRGFRRNEFQMLLDGDIIETGLAFIYSRDFSKFKELFKRRVKTEEQILPSLDEGILPEEEEELEEDQEEVIVKPIGNTDGLEK